MARQSDLESGPGPGRSLRRNLVRFAVVAGVILAAYLLLGWVEMITRDLEPGTRQALMGGTLVALLLAYAVLIALPFVPGIEIGITLMILRGADIAPAVYLATVTGLTAAFLAGRFLDRGWLARLFADLRLARAAALMTEIDPLPRERRLVLLRQALPGRLGDVMVRFRHVALALLLNLPGNAVLGGGGGICLAAGVSGLYASRAAILTIALAVAPVPLAVIVLGARPLALWW